MTMKLDLQSLKNSPGKRFPFDWTESIEQIDSRDRKLPLVKPVSAKGNVFFQEGLLLLELDLETEVQAECSRCLSPINIPVSISDELEFLEEPKGGLDSALIEEFSFAFGIDELDLTPYLGKLIAAQIETKPLCKSDCEGICSECGIDLNTESCDCASKKSTDPRLEKLKELL